MDKRGEHAMPPNQSPSPPSVPLRDAHADPPFDVADRFVRLQVYFQSWHRLYRFPKGSRSHGDEKGRGSAAHFDISDPHSSSSSSDWAIPFHFGDPAEDGPSLDVTHAFDPEALREIEMSIQREEVSLDHMD